LSLREVHTYLGTHGQFHHARKEPQQALTRSERFTWLIFSSWLSWVPLVFFYQRVYQARLEKEHFFFAMAVPLAWTPEMLPNVVSVCLAKGALAMSRKKVS